MNDFIEQVVTALGPRVTPRLSSELDLAPDLAGKILPLISPLLLGALKKKKDTDGIEAMEAALRAQADEAALEDLEAGVTRRATAPDDDPGLGGLLGSAGTAAADLLQDKLGLSPSQARNAIYTVGPIVLGYLLKQKAGTGSGGIDAISAVLDRDGDGGMMDDVGGMLFNHLKSRYSSSSGGVASALGAFLKD